jgi:La domain
VEYYFSDTNLRSDTHLLSLCGGAENRPVSIGEIMSFKKMRKFIPNNRKLIAAALKKSTFLDVVNENQVRRKVPLILEQDEDDDYGSDDGNWVEQKKSKSPAQPNKTSTPQEELPPWMTKGMVG